MEDIDDLETRLETIEKEGKTDKTDEKERSGSDISSATSKLNALSVLLAALRLEEMLQNLSSSQNPRDEDEQERLIEDLQCAWKNKIVCNICKTIFTTESDLGTHKLSEDGVSCDTCRQGVNMKLDLSRHKETHHQPVLSPSVPGTIQ